jgi:hypothetical protein
MNEKKLFVNGDFLPQRLVPPFAWIGHIPFIHWLVLNLKCQTYVELGTHTGNSYFSVCDTVKLNNLDTKCFAIDSWEGEIHAGFYDDYVYKDVCSWNESNFSEFSTLLRMMFDEALSNFRENSIDLLHIDGLHTYEAVKNDYETWLPKVNENGIILFHDIAAYHDDFGVYKLWNELKKKYFSFDFIHSYGLGVLYLGKNLSSLPSSVQELFKVADDSLATLKIRELFTNKFVIMNNLFMSHNKAFGLNIKKSYLYFSTSLQFEEKNKIEQNLFIDEVTGSFSLHFINLNCNNFRWDPLENHSCRIKDLQIEVKSESYSEVISKNLFRLNGLYENDTITFTTFDPCVGFSSKFPINEVLISGKIELLPQMFVENAWKLDVSSQNEMIKNLNFEKSRLTNSLNLIKKIKYKEKSRIYNFCKYGMISVLKKINYLDLYNKLRKSILFDKNYYLDMCLTNGILPDNLILHYLVEGSKLKFNTHPLFDSEFYCSQITDSCTIPLLNYLEETENIYDPHPLFDTNFYLQQLKNRPNKSCLEHFLDEGWKQGLNPSPFFDVKYYLINNPEVEADGINPLVHFVLYGWSEGRSPNKTNDFMSIIKKIDFKENVFIQMKKHIINNK